MYRINRQAWARGVVAALALSPVVGAVFFAAVCLAIVLPTQ